MSRKFGVLPSVVTSGVFRDEIKNDAPRLTLNGMTAAKNVKIKTEVFGM